VQTTKLVSLNLALTYKNSRVIFAQNFKNKLRAILRAIPASAEKQSLKFSILRTNIAVK